MYDEESGVVYASTHAGISSHHTEHEPACVSPNDVECVPDGIDEGGNAIRKDESHRGQDFCLDGIDPPCGSALLDIAAIGVDGKRPDFHLRVCTGKHADSVYSIPPISQQPTIGRSRKNAICLLHDEQVSRVQSYFATTPDQYVMLCDGTPERTDGSGASFRGTFLNCISIKRGHRIRYGDVILVGATELVVEKNAIRKSHVTLQSSETKSGCTPMLLRKKSVVLRGMLATGFLAVVCAIVLIVMLFAHLL